MSEVTKPENDSSENDKLNKELLKPVTKSDSKIEDELKELEVENSGGGKDGGGGWNSLFYDELFMALIMMFKVVMDYN